ncbi:GntR family transcriptional regulator [Prosthecomicrobium pneumaticum]|uniref:DNA-binding GntR family transcriptional regulator n=1 Tax=Prosthecomicrobium pneumaticum TaxID=81895 RepID=A0A7W9CVI1_9HYPH|nr:FCD domain-containing protein [Prosthecomicrobium pneumaticum]MBB5752700.1 DNA-binding GntR family transcriptional regulator [Prosthecomicrobium pneumaticum]
MKNPKPKDFPQKRRSAVVAARPVPAAAGGAEDASSAEAFKLLRADIISGELAAGARLRFIELQARYGLGTSPLREALSRLAADRLVLQEVNRGFRVPPLSRADFKDIARLRIELERSAIEAAVRSGDEAWEEGVVLAHHRLRRLGRQEAAPEEPAVPEEWEARHRAYHAALIAACPSPWTLHFCAVLHDQFDRYRRAAGRDPVVQIGLSRQHEQLIEAALARDAARAGAVLAEHIADTAEAVLARMDRIETVAAGE